MIIFYKFLLTFLRPICIFNKLTNDLNLQMFIVEINIFSTYLKVLAHAKSKMLEAIIIIEIMLITHFNYKHTEINHIKDEFKYDPENRKTSIKMFIISHIFKFSIFKDVLNQPSTKSHRDFHN